VLTDEQLFQYVNEVVVRDRLYLDSRFGRQTLIDTFQLSKERIGAMFSKGCEYSNLSDYVKHLRLQYATKLLVEQPQKSIEEIATDCGFNSHKYFSDRFRQLFSMTPTEFRRARQ
jgi:transcriptional regulator GlxA family with amidase domain